MAKTEQEKTILELLETTCQPQHKLGEGGRAIGYQFPTGFGLNNYILRVEKNFDLENLTAATSLVPFPRQPNYMDIGQPLMTLNATQFGDLSIVKRHPGQSLDDIRLHLVERYSSLEYPKIEATIALMKRILKLKEYNGSANPFIPILKIAQTLRAYHENTDISMGNIFLNDRTHALGLIDQIQIKRVNILFGTEPPTRTEQRKNIQYDAGRLFVMMTGYDIATNIDPSTTLAARYYRAADELKKTIGEAQGAVLKNAKNTSPIAFATITDTRPVTVSNPPRVLVERLRELQKFSNGPQK